MSIEVFKEPGKNLLPCGIRRVILWHPLTTQETGRQDGVAIIPVSNDQHWFPCHEASLRKDEGRTQYRVIVLLHGRTGRPNLIPCRHDLFL
jgi:hypothetical protein